MRRVPRQHRAPAASLVLRSLLERRMDRLEKHVDDIDRDVQAITRRVMPE